MPTSVDVAVRVNIAGSNLIDQAGPETVTATDDISFDLAPGSSDLPVAIQPGPATAIVYLVVSVAHATPAVSYRPSLGAPAIPLRGPHVYSGPGMASLLDANPTTLYFTNAGPDVVAVRVLVMRAS